MTFSSIVRSKNALPRKVCAKRAHAFRCGVEFKNLTQPYLFLGSKEPFKFLFAALAAFAADPRFIPCAIRRPHETAPPWAPEFAGRAAVVICERGQRSSEGAAAWLLHAGVTSAEVLVGGHPFGHKRALPFVPEGKLSPRDP
jgi:rhodanese-related sulfurtransferase